MRFVVIGATHGLGLVLTEKLLTEGNDVAAGVIDRDVPESLKPLLEKYKDKLLVKSADVTNENEIEAFAKAAADFMGKVDAVCTVAGIMKPSDKVNKLHEVDVADLRATFDVNTFGPIICAKHFYPIMEKGGKILTITSEAVSVSHVWPGTPCYALSKTAATKLCGILKTSVEDVDFYAVHPGRPMTLMNQNGEIPAEESAEGIYKLMAGITSISREVWYVDYKGNPMDM
ncbi:MAG: SDR family NAD(P)-dependent oxidoreductase [Oscillospiraceae bacterium]|jgi:NAD(P)-dependent dehydrogenase (short-subunit alcohol dehydrogenase family)|nr:SDR family NAD(P)-dependent oxidoreductase [Oscillospiraceae bacterium]